MSTQDATSQGNDVISPFHCPMHAGLFEALPNDGAAACFHHPEAYEQTLPSKIFL
jgi:hypothetical protein